MDPQVVFFIPFWCERLDVTWRTEEIITRTPELLKICAFDVVRRASQVWLLRVRVRPETAAGKTFLFVPQTKKQLFRKDGRGHGEIEKKRGFAGTFINDCGL